MARPLGDLALDPAAVEGQSGTPSRDWSSRDASSSNPDAGVETTHRQAPVPRRAADVWELRSPRRLQAEWDELLDELAADQCGVESNRRHGA